MLIFANDLRSAQVKIIALAVAFSAMTSFAQAQSARVTGTAGYLSEWEFDGNLAQNGSDGKEFAGSVMWKHIGLCSVHGPEEKPGDMSIQISDSGRVPAIHAMLKFDGVACKYTGAVSESSTGSMDCSNAKGIPLTFSITSSKMQN